MSLWLATQEPVRWLEGKDLVSMAGELEASIAAPNACRLREMINTTTFGAKPQVNELNTNTAKPIR
jgi:hypothetical protein